MRWARIEMKNNRKIEKSTKNRGSGKKFKKFNLLNPKSFCPETFFNPLLPSKLL
jgi:hypothetical protein